MLIVHKQPLQPGLNHLSLPLGAQVLHAAMQADEPHLWYLRPKLAPATENRVFLFVGTGHDIAEPLDRQAWVHISSMIDEPFVWHVFELVTEHAKQTGDQLVGEDR